MRISDWSSDVCSSDLPVNVGPLKVQLVAEYRGTDLSGKVLRIENKSDQAVELTEAMVAPASALAVSVAERTLPPGKATTRTEEHTSELQSLMRISYAVFFLKKKQKILNNKQTKFL